MAGEDSATNSNFSKHLELSKTSQARKSIVRTQVFIDKPTVADITLPSRWYIGGSAKICNPHIGVVTLYISCKVTFKFKFQLNLVNSMLSGTASGPMDICG